MSNPKHTPGPWLYVAGDDGTFPGVLIPREKGRSPRELVINEPMGCCMTDYDANARLIAAAPELLEALGILTVWLEDSIELLGEDPADDARVKKARAAIAKATGNS